MKIEDFIGVHGITLQPTTASPDLLRGEATDPAFPPNPDKAVLNQ